MFETLLAPKTDMEIIEYAWFNSSPTDYCIRPFSMLEIA